MLGLDSSGITVSVTNLSASLLTTAFKGSPTLSLIVSITCQPQSPQYKAYHYKQLGNKYGPSFTFSKKIRETSQL